MHGCFVNIPINVYRLTHCRLTELAIMQDSYFDFRYVSLCDLDIPEEKWLNYLQTVGLHCLPNTLLWVSRLQWVNYSSR